ncbi:MAG: hypothetical protein B7X99_15640 [Rhizobiales bacterium 17-65-6]|nr:MAG: hypothetical protein B7Z30_06025 [Rhizobiales bacterium 12-68-15]OYX83885.1 MAG: hypothetical protein B7Y84_17660 [Azorhizobium sp. 32-67-21]OYZ93293.1 MAG: hypothetical protein B7X99_15640 [Rhizobiales bacterium 17-65-6]
MLIPQQIGPTEAAQKNIQEGWWALTESGEPVAGPYPTKEAAMIGIGKRGEAQPTGRPGEKGPPPE